MKGIGLIILILEKLHENNMRGERFELSDPLRDRISQIPKNLCPS